MEFMRYRRRLPSLMAAEDNGGKEPIDSNRLAKMFVVGEGKSEDEDEVILLVFSSFR